MPDRAMNLRDAVDLLQATPLFANIEPSKLKLLAYASDEARFCTGDTLFVQGGASDVAYVIAEGEVEVTWEGPHGASVLARLGQHEVVGEIALLAGVPSMTTVVARSPLVALRIKGDLFVKMIEEYPRIAVAIIRELARVIGETAARLETATGEVAAD